MNKCYFTACRLVKDPEYRVNGDSGLVRFSVAVDRQTKKDGGQEADFPNLIAFGKTAEFISNYMHKGTKVNIESHVNTGSYEKNGQRVYTTNFVVEHIEFCESKTNSDSTSKKDNFVNIPDNVPEELPFN